MGQLGKGARFYFVQRMLMESLSEKPGMENEKEPPYGNHKKTLQTVQMQMPGGRNKIALLEEQKDDRWGCGTVVIGKSGTKWEWEGRKGLDPPWLRRTILMGLDFFLNAMKSNWKISNRIAEIRFTFGRVALAIGYRLDINWARELAVNPVQRLLEKPRGERLWLEL